VRDHKGITVKNVRGLWVRGTEDVCPEGYFLVAHNVIYTQFGVKTREGISLYLTFPNLVRFHIYKRIGEADRLLLLNTSGQLFDSTNLTTPILTIVAMTDFSMVTMFNRAYITPHNGQRGLPGEKLYVYGGSGTARPAAGSPPSGFTLVVNDAAAVGNIEKGDHLFAVAFETDTGYITRPGPTGNFVKYVAPGAKKAKVTAIPIGPAGTVARYVLATKTIINYNGNQLAQEFFFVPNGKISNNVDVELDNVNFFDSDLLASADYLIDNLDIIPAFLGVADYNGNLVGWGEDTKESIIRVSKSGEPESMSGVDGFVIVNPGDGGGINACVVYRSQLHAYKDQRHYITANNGNAPVSWQVELVDAAIGTDVFGVAQVLDSRGQTADQFIIASRTGLLQYFGSYAVPLSNVINDIWKRINFSAFNKVQVAVDPNQKRLYVTLPLDASTTINTILMMDFNDGLSWESVKWSIWEFAGLSVKSIAVDTLFTNQVPVFTIGAANNIYRLSASVLNDVDVAIPVPEIEYALEPEDNQSFLNHYTGVRVRVVGSGVLQVRVSGSDRNQTLNAKDIVMSAAPGYEMSRLFDFQAERASISFRVESIDEWFHINKRTMFIAPLWLSRGE